MKPKQIIIASLMLFCCILAAVDYNHEEHHTVVISDIQTLQRVSSSDGKVETRYENRVITDKGVFLVNTSGLYSHPEVLGMIHKDDTVIISTRGYEISVLGKLRNIVEVKTKRNDTRRSKLYPVHTKLPHEFGGRTLHYLHGNIQESRLRLLRPSTLSKRTATRKVLPSLHGRWQGVQVR